MTKCLNAARKHPKLILRADKSLGRRATLLARKPFLEGLFLIPEKPNVRDR